QIIQNKLHYAITGHTAPEIVFSRANAQQVNMGLTTMKSNYPQKADITVAKNYLLKNELEDLNQMSSAFLDIAERQARRKKQMKMVDWITQVDRYIELTDDILLQDKGKITRKQANEKALEEFIKYKTLNPPNSPIVKDYLENLSKEIERLEGK
ncbi:Virulence protein RhuM family protein, partial [Pilibacter termitis]